MYIYHVDGRDYTEEEIDDLLNLICDPEYYEDDTDSFDEYLNDEYSSVSICGYSYYPADVLYHCSEDAYYEAKREWAENEADHYKYEYSRIIGNMCDDDVEELNGYVIECEEIDEEEEQDSADTSSFQSLRESIANTQKAVQAEQSLWEVVFS